MARLQQRSASRTSVCYHCTTTARRQRADGAVRLAYGLRPRDHVSAAAIELHSVPVEARIQFNLCLLVHLYLSSATRHLI